MYTRLNRNTGLRPLADDIQYILLLRLASLLLQYASLSKLPTLRYICMTSRAMRLIMMSEPHQLAARATIGRPSDLKLVCHGIQCKHMHIHTQVTMRLARKPECALRRIIAHFQYLPSWAQTHISIETLHGGDSPLH